MGDEITLEYGKRLQGYAEGTGPVRVYGSNGPVGWTSDFLHEGPGVILGRKGAYRGVQFSAEPFFVIDTAYYVEPKTDIDMRWLYYAIIYHKLGHIDDGSPIPSTTRAAVYVKDLQVPPPDEQHEIASILGALDDKIEANRRMNETLEAMARALFKSWFVDFDPVHAKAKGQTPTQISKKTATLFPGTFNENGLPMGWEQGQVSDLCMKIENGGTPKRSIVEYWTPGEMNWLASGEVRQPIIITTENRISKEGYNNSSAKLWPEHTIIVALYGATAGQVTYLAIPSTANQACCGLQAISEAAQYLYTVLALNTQQLEQRARGSAQQNLSKQLVSEFPIIIPPQSVLQNFESLVVQWRMKAISNLHESKTLANLRDTLLPKLMSGKIRVRDAEKEVEAII